MRAASKQGMNENPNENENEERVFNHNAFMWISSIMSDPGRTWVLHFSLSAALGSPAVHNSVPLASLRALVARFVKAGDVERLTSLARCLRADVPLDNGNVPWTPEDWTMYCAGAGFPACVLGRPAMLALLHAHGCLHGDRRILARLAARGHIDGIAALRALPGDNYDWDENVCANAAVFGQLECMAYLIEHDCPWNPDTVVAWATVNKHWDCVRYAHEHTKTL